MSFHRETVKAAFLKRYQGQWLLRGARDKGPFPEVCWGWAPTSGNNVGTATWLGWIDLDSGVRGHVVDMTCGVAGMGHWPP